MYYAKKSGRQNYQCFRPEMIVEAVECRSIERDLRLALDRNEFTLHYQPKIDLKTGSIVGAEALSRWIHPTRGPVSPAQFIPIAEEAGLILPIGAWVLREACTQARAWADAGMKVKTVTVNVSETELQSDQFLDGLFETLNTTGLDPKWLELDITESALRKRIEHKMPILKVLRDRGVKVSADNFGTGYSSLASLQKVPLDALKIDRTFIRRITDNSGETTKVSAMVEMGRKLKLRVVANGVERTEDLELLWDHNCDEALGYYFGEPAPPEQFCEMLRSQVISTSRNSIAAA